MDGPELSQQPYWKSRKNRRDADDHTHFAVRMRQSILKVVMRGSRLSGRAVGC